AGKNLDARNDGGALLPGQAFDDVEDAVQAVRNGQLMLAGENVDVGNAVDAGGFDQGVDERDDVLLSQAHGGNAAGGGGGLARHGFLRGHFGAGMLGNLRVGRELAVVRRDGLLDLAGQGDERHDLHGGDLGDGFDGAGVGRIGQSDPQL